MKNITRKFFIFTPILLISSSFCFSVEFPKISLESIASSYDQSSVRGIWRVASARGRNEGPENVYVLEPAIQVNGAKKNIQLCSSESLGAGSLLILLATEPSLAASCHSKSTSEHTLSDQVLFLPGLEFYLGSQPKLYFRLPNNTDLRKRCGSEELFILNNVFIGKTTGTELKAKTGSDGIYISREGFLSCIDQVRKEKIKTKPRTPTISS